MHIAPVTETLIQLIHDNIFKTDYELYQKWK